MERSRGTTTAEATQVVFPAAGVIAVEQHAVPEPGPRELRLRVTRVGICATDLHLLDGHIGDPFPLVPGHEFIGVVEAVGADDRRGIAVGTHVAVEMLVPCRSCARCREGRYNLCEADDPGAPGPGRQLGVNIPRTVEPFAGGYATHLIVPEAAVVHALPAGLDLDTAVLVEPLAVACRAVARGRVRLGDTVVIIGPGPIGLLSAAAAASAGAAEIIVVGGRPERRAIASRFGATAHIGREHGPVAERLATLLPGGADVVIECAGVVEAQQDAIAYVRRGGRVVLAGACGGGAHLRIAPDESLLTREIDVLPSFLSAGGFEPAIGLLASGRFPFGALVTHVFPLADVERALDAVRSRTEGLIKAVLAP